MNVNDLESGLLYFYNNRNDYQYHKHIYQHLNKLNIATSIETLLILEKLKKDGYIIEEEQPSETRDAKTNVLKEESINYGYFITYDGMLFVEAAKDKYNGKPYQYALMLKAKRERSERRENWPKRNWPIVAAISFLIGTIGTPLALKYIERKIWPDTTQSSTPTPIGSDTVRSAMSQNHR